VPVALFPNQYLVSPVYILLNPSKDISNILKPNININILQGMMRFFELLMIHKLEYW